MLPSHDLHTAWPPTALFTSRRGALVALSTLALAAPAAAQSAAPGPFRVPENYLGRFGGVGPIVDVSDKGDLTRVGLSGLPLPTAYDLRFTVANRPGRGIWDYSVSTRMNDTTYLLGTEDGSWRAEAVHNPYTGPQFTGILRQRGLSELSAGYAYVPQGSPARVLSKVGVAASGDRREPFAHSQVSTTYTASAGPVNFRVAPLAQLYAYPFDSAVQSSAEVVLSANVAPTPQLLLEASHLERFSVGRTPIPEYAINRAQESTLQATYRVPYAGDPAFGIGALRGGYTHNWQDHWNFFRADVFLRSNALPVMVGPRAEYRLAPDGQGRWIYGLVTLGK